MKTKILLVVAAAQGNQVIGTSENKLPWSHISGDLKNFKKETLGNPIIMGRVTFETFPKNEDTGLPKPLPKRLNIVITRNTDYKVPEGVLIADSLEKAIEYAKESAPEKICIIGGEQIYNMSLPLADEISYTEIKLIVSGTTKFPPIPDYFKRATAQSCSESVMIDGKEKTIRFEIQKWIRR